MARANWLIVRVQNFKFRVPILEEIEKTLSEVRDEGSAVDFASLKSELSLNSNQVDPDPKR